MNRDLKKLYEDKFKNSPIRPLFCYYEIFMPNGKTKKSITFQKRINAKMILRSGVVIDIVNQQVIKNRYSNDFSQDLASYYMRNHINEVASALSDFINIMVSE